MLNKITLSVAAALGLVQADKLFTIDPAIRGFRDRFGRHTIFHGVNVVYKIDPYIPTDGVFDPENSLNDEDIENMQKWGFNFVRLGVMWEAVERTKGTFDQDYLTKVDALITKLGEKGIYTLIDAHQDVLARIQCGEGIPNFYAKEVIAGGTHCIDPDLDK